MNPKIDASVHRFTWGLGNVVQPQEVQSVNLIRRQSDAQSDWSTVVLDTLHCSLYLEWNVEYVASFLPFKTMVHFQRQETGIRTQTLISPPACSLPQFHYLAGFPTVETFYNTLWLEAYFFKGNALLWRASKPGLEEADGGSVWSLHHIFILISFSFPHLSFCGKTFSFKNVAVMLLRMLYTVGQAGY